MPNRQKISGSRGHRELASAALKFGRIAAVTLLGWTLLISEVGRTCPKGTDCFYTLDARAEFMAGFKTKKECEKAGADWVRDFYASAKKDGETVVAGPAKPQCLEDKQK